MCPRQRSKEKKKDPAEESLFAAAAFLAGHPLFAPLKEATVIVHKDSHGNECPKEGWAVVRKDGYIHVRPARKLKEEHWQYILAHELLHLGLGHFHPRPNPREWNHACCVFVNKFLQDLKIGQAPERVSGKIELPGQDEESIYARFCREGVPREFMGLSTAGENCADMVFAEDSSNQSWRYLNKRSYEDLLADGLRTAVVSAVNVAGGLEPHLGADQKLKTVAQRAHSWFISSYPLLGALAASFKIIEDVNVCHNLEVCIAAIDSEMKEIYINPGPKLDEYQMRFVLGHELLHVGLRHESRRHGRDPYLWNVACDYVINGWLVEMGVGELPHVGGLYDHTLKGMSAEEIYLRIVSDVRRYRKLATLRGVGLGDVLEHRHPDWSQAGVDLDEFYRGCLADGLRFHEQAGRGTLPSGLVEEIRALTQPAIPWDVELAQWFDNYFAPLEKVRSYLRPSRRQSASPDIPRARYVPQEGALDGRTFGVILDTSGSMDRKLLAKALGSIASYSVAREIPFARVIFCDAAPYDEGYMPPEQIAESVRVKGRGGTTLQPGVNLLESAKDFPEKGPLLIITDGCCDRLVIRREHAFLIPYGRHLPFMPKGKVFYIR